MSIRISQIQSERRAMQIPVNGYARFQKNELVVAISPKARAAIAMNFRKKISTLSHFFVILFRKFPSNTAKPDPKRMERIQQIYLINVIKQFTLHLHTVLPASRS